MIRLDLWLTLPDGARLRAAELAFADPDGQGRYASALRYTPDYLADARAFALDPAALPLEVGEYQADRLQAPLLVLEDALPDDWGRRLLILAHRLPRGRQSEPELMRVLAGGGLGALAFWPPGEPPREPVNDASIRDLAGLVEAAGRLEADGPLEAPEDDAWRALLTAGSSPGGARPKALVRDGVPDGPDQWIAKFPSRRDEVDMVGLEATSLELARLAGLEVPEFRILPLPDQRRVLLVRRFDLTPAGGRSHMLSFRALLQAGGWYVLGYADLIAALRRHSARPEADVPALYRQMVFNALLGNTDDHLKNFWMVHTREGWCLSPAFDLLPDTGGRREHVLVFHLSAHPPGPRGLADLGRRWGVSGAAPIVAQVQAALDRFPEVAAAHGVPEADIRRFSADMARRRSKES